MAGIAESRTWDLLLTTTMAHYKKKMIDNISDVYPTLAWFIGDLGRRVRGNDRLVLLNGGESIVEHLMYEFSTAGGPYSGYEVLDTTPQEGATIARYNWKQYAWSVSINGLEERSNAGDAQMINMLRAKTTQAEMTMRNELSTDMFGDGTRKTSKVITGLGAVVATTGTYAGLNRSTYSWWQAKVKTSAGSFAANGIKEMRIKFDDVTYGNDHPDFIVTDQATYEYYEASLQPQMRVPMGKIADGGFTALEFRGVPVIFDRDCTAGYMYFLNSKYLTFHAHRDAFFEIGPFIKPEDKDARTAQILFQGNLTSNNCRMQGVVQGYTA